MEGRVDMDALATDDLWDGVGLGTSQKCEVATLEAQTEVGFFFALDIPGHPLDSAV